jgi:hypothetical protein
MSNDAIELDSQDREELIQWWLGGSEERDAPILTDGYSTFSTKDIANEIRADTAEGRALIRELLHLRSLQKQTK